MSSSSTSSSGESSDDRPIVIPSRDVVVHKSSSRQAVVSRSVSTNISLASFDRASVAGMRMSRLGRATVTPMRTNDNLAKAEELLEVYRSKSSIQLAENFGVEIPKEEIPPEVVEARFLASLLPTKLEMTFRKNRQARGRKTFKDSGPNTRFRDTVRELLVLIRGQGLGTDTEDAASRSKLKAGDELTFDPTVFRAGSGGNAANLAKQCNQLFQKSFLERTEEDLDMLYPVINQMKYFRCFSVTARREMSRVLDLVSYESGRVIIKQGHKGRCMYYIVSGSVAVKISWVDKATGEMKKAVVAKLKEGTSFGELALVQDCTRSATIECIEDSTFLTIAKDDLEVSQVKSQLAEVENRKALIKSLRYFKLWDEQTIHLAMLNSKILTFEPGQIIVGNIHWDPPEFFYVVVKGQCKLLKKVLVTETSSHLQPSQKLLKFVKNESDVGPGEVLKCRILQIGTINEGEMFSIGESLKRTYIMADSKVKCLCMSGYMFDTIDRMARCAPVHDRREVVETRSLRETAEQRAMSEEEAYEAWLVNLKWSSYRKRLVRGIVGRKSDPDKEGWKRKAQRSSKPSATTENISIGENQLSHIEFRSMATLKKAYSRGKYERLLKRLRMELREELGEESSSEEDVEEEEVEIPCEEERMMMRRSFSGGSGDDGALATKVENSGKEKNERKSSVDKKEVTE